MAAGMKTITIRFKGDESGLAKSARNSEHVLGKFASGFGSTLRRVGEVAAGVLGAQVFDRAIGAVKDFVTGSVEAFSGLNESLNAVDKVFDTSAGEIKKWGEQNANALGLSTRAFNELATPLGAMLKNAGLSLPQTTKWTEQLTERAADMASVFNVDVSEALTAIQAGLRGESDPLERFGVSLSAAKVEAAALAATGKKTAKELTDQEKATARLNLIMQQTASTAGDFRGTSDGLANSQRIAAAKTEELQAKIGQKLAPVMAKVTELKLKLVGVIADKVLPAFEKFIKSPFAGWVKGTVLPALADFGRALLAVGEKVIQFGQWLNEHRDVLLAFAIGVAAVVVPAFIAWAVSAATAAVATIAATWPILAIIAAVALLAFGIIQLVKHWDTIWGHIWGFMKAVGAWFAGPFAGFFVKTWNAIQAGALKVRDWIRQNWPLLLSILTGPIGAAVIFTARHWEQIKAGATLVYNWVRGKFDALVGFFRGLPGRISSATAGMFNGIWQSFRAAVNRIISAWNNLSFTIGGGSVFGVNVPSVTLSTPNLPHLATGGRVLQSGLAVIHKGETVVPAAQTTPLPPEVLELHLDLSEGIRQVITINLREHDRRLRRRTLAGAGVR